jgi:hypothetical protein
MVAFHARKDLHRRGGGKMKILNDNQLEEVLHAEKYFEKREQYVERMLNDGYNIYYPDNNELQIDIDSPRALEIFNIRFKRLREELRVDDEDAEARVYESKTPGHYHVVVKLPFVPDNHYERIALQAVLNSDPVREMLSLFRVWRGDPYPTLLARKEI